MGASTSPRHRLLRLVAVFAAAHLLLALGSLLTSSTLVMSRFDAAEFLEPSVIERAASGTASVLFQPARSILRGLGPGSRPTFVQWLALGCNSLLWGLAVALVFRRLTRRSTRPPTDGPSPPLSEPVDSVR